MVIFFRDSDDLCLQTDVASYSWINKGPKRAFSHTLYSSFCLSQKILFMKHPLILWCMDYIITPPSAGVIIIAHMSLTALYCSALTVLYGKHSTWQLLWYYILHLKYLWCTNNWIGNWYWSLSAIIFSIGIGYFWKIWLIL